MKTSVTSTYDDDANDDDGDTDAARDIFDSSVARASPVSTPQYSCSEPPPVPVRTIKCPSVEPAVQLVAQPVAQPAMGGEVDEPPPPPAAAVAASPEAAPRPEPRVSERWSDSTQPEDVELETLTSDTELANAQCEPASEMYYTASSEVSLISDTEVVDRPPAEDEDKDDRKNVIAGHVAAMRERFESMTRTNTPCPDLIRSLSPSLEVFRNVSPSPDRLT